MKKAIYLFLSITIVLTSLSACSSDSSSDNSNGGDNPSLIVGSWEYVKLSNYLNGEFMFDIPFEHDCPTKKDYLTFNADGSMMNYDHDASCDVTPIPGVYTISGNSLIVTEEGEDPLKAYEIITLNANTLIVIIPNPYIDEEEEEEEEEEDEIPSFTVRMELKRK